MPTCPLLRRPMLAAIMANRPLAVFGTIFVSLQVLLGLLGLPVLQCPIPPLTGSHCPGCGMTRAVEAFGRGEWQEAMRLHAFGPAIALGFLFVVLSVVLPAERRARLIEGVAHVERRTGITALVLIGLVIYWGIRLAAGHGRIPALG